MFSSRKKYEVSDPGFYSRLIADQKTLLRKNPDDAEEWVKLGTLYENRISMMRDYAKKYFFLRYFYWVFLLTLLIMAVVHIYVINNLLFLTYGKLIAAVYYLLMVLTQVAIFRLRYPPSGRAYFKKALKLDTGCAEAYHHLGLIAYRRGRIGKAFRLLERAAALDTEEGSAKSLGSIFRKEFESLITERKKREKRLESENEQYAKENKKLRAANSDLKNRVDNLTGRISQAKWKAGRTVKLLNEEMDAYIQKVKADYENQIFLLQREAEEEAMEMAAKDRVRLTTEILESKADSGSHADGVANDLAADSMGPVLWHSLSERSRLYLNTAEKVYASLSEADEKSDFSLVGMELCKALETEINRRFVVPFAGYLNGNRAAFLKINQTGERQDKPVYFTYLAKVVDNVHYPEVNTLTLGQYLFILKRVLNNDYSLREYARFLHRLRVSSTVGIDHEFSVVLEKVVKKYRNTIAHQEPMNKAGYEKLRSLILSGEKALLKTCGLIGVDSAV